MAAILLGLVATQAMKTLVGPKWLPCFVAAAGGTCLHPWLRGQCTRAGVGKGVGSASSVAGSTSRRPASRPQGVWAGHRALKHLPVHAVASPSVGPQAGITPELIRSQNSAGHKMRDLGVKLQREEFEVEALGGHIHATFDGLQRLQRVDISEGALQMAGDDRTQLAQELLGALQQAHDNSQAASQGEVWQLYKDNVDLLQAPLVQIGAGATAEDLWANVAKNDVTIGLAEELFDHFDADDDGYWSLQETSQVQLATEGTEMTEESFNLLIISVADNKGRNLVEADLALGLSRAQVVDLYTDAQRQRSLGFVLDIYRDHAIVFGKEDAPKFLGEEAKVIDVAQGLPARD